MATSLNSEVCEVDEEDAAVSVEVMEGKLSEFLGRKCILEGLSKDKFSNLKRLQEALEKEVKVKKLDS